MKTKGLFYTVMGAFLVGFISFTSLEGTPTSDIAAIYTGSGTEIMAEPECREEEPDSELLAEFGELVIF